MENKSKYEQLSFAGIFLGVLSLFLTITYLLITFSEKYHLNSFVEMFFPLFCRATGISGLICSILYCAKEKENFAAGIAGIILSSIGLCASLMTQAL